MDVKLVLLQYEKNMDWYIYEQGAEENIWIWERETQEDGQQHMSNFTIYTVHQILLRSSDQGAWD